MSFLDDIYRITEHLYQGAYWPRINFKKLDKAGITAIVNLMEDKTYTPPKRKYAYLHKGFPDDTYPPHDYITEILSFIDYHIKEKKGKVLVHCSLGISRSGGIVAAYVLKENPTWSWSEAIEFIHQNRKVYPAVEIRESVLDYLESIEGKRRQY